MRSRLLFGSGFKMRETTPLKRYLRCTVLCAALLLFETEVSGCATVNCEAEGKHTGSSARSAQADDARAKCEKRLADLRRATKQQEQEGAAADRRDAFVGRARGRATSQP